MPDERTEQIGFRATPEEVEMLTKLAEKEERTTSDVMRRLIRHAYAEAFPATKKKTRR